MKDKILMQVKYHKPYPKLTIPTADIDDAKIVEMRIKNQGTIERNGKQYFFRELLVLYDEA